MSSPCFIYIMYKDKQGTKYHAHEVIHCLLADMSMTVWDVIVGRIEPSYYVTLIGQTLHSFTNQLVG